MEQIDEVKNIVNAIKAIKRTQENFQEQIKLVGTDNFKGLDLIINLDPKIPTKPENVLDSDGSLRIDENGNIRKSTSSFFTLFGSPEPKPDTNRHLISVSSDMNSSMYFGIINIISKELEQRLEYLEEELKNVINKL